jgi:hypothetical protein
MDTPWPRGAAMHAVCPHTAEQRKDETLCKCGVNAYAEQGQFEASTCVAHPVYGTVALWGQVGEYETGWRAGFAQPTELWVRPEHPDAELIAGQLAQAYSCPVHIAPAQLGVVAVAGVRLPCSARARRTVRIQFAAIAIFAALAPSVGVWAALSWVSGPNGSGWDFMLFVMPGAATVATIALTFLSLHRHSPGREPECSCRPLAWALAVMVAPVVTGVAVLIVTTAMAKAAHMPGFTDLAERAAKTHHAVRVTAAKQAAHPLLFAWQYSYSDLDPCHTTYEYKTHSRVRVCRHGGEIEAVPLESAKLADQQRRDAAVRREQ